MIRNVKLVSFIAVGIALKHFKEIWKVYIKREINNFVYINFSHAAISMTLE